MTHATNGTPIKPVLSKQRIVLLSGGGTVSRAMRMEELVPHINNKRYPSPIHYYTRRIIVYHHSDGVANI